MQSHARLGSMQYLRLGALILAVTTTIAAADKPLSLDDLGMSDTKAANASLQRDLEKRSTMLQWHQWLGLAAFVPMAAGYMLGDDARNADTRAWHMGLGIAATSLYMGSAAMAIFAPKPDGVRDTGSTRWHRYLSYLHFPLMIAVPILGNMARQQVERGEHVSGIASAHGAAATALMVTYTVAITIMVFNF